MKLRWSNGRSFSDEFQANSRDTLLENGTASLRLFRAATYRTVHRGEIQKNELWFDNPELHVAHNGRWYNPGYIEKVNGIHYFEPKQVRMAVSAPDLDTIHSIDAVFLQQNGEDIWRGVHDLYHWVNGLDAVVMEVGDALERIDTTAELARKGGQSTSAAKRAAARANGKKGGRPLRALT